MTDDINLTPDDDTGTSFTVHRGEQTLGTLFMTAMAESTGWLATRPDGQSKIVLTQEQAIEWLETRVPQ